MSLGLDEAKSEEVDREREVDAGYRALRIIWFAILMSVAAIFIVTRLVEPTPGLPLEMFWILLALGAGLFGASFFLKQRMLRQAVEKRKPELVRGAYILASALCEAIALFGLLVHITTGARYYYFFFVLSGFGVLLHKPERDDLLAAYQGGGIWAARRNN